ncbi:3'(2'),5'-bisphosphate nucleotidase CysQ [Leisingera sp. McT4-56]|uniref:3'(2'),5'-bisphosphate nucleotidase CysQ n=1 Tax=Leisingera sp. McT4-56 TaxID=2881255 RepID=UPI001CF88218|nr:3'(2'),5'-bisphosphate nucleotidase CysQ [Leisingera sp. McT4-56]MCB4457659.1 3'(2'),5'-bisphosphate nucleotidase CysQ [Leisingera sp. McT4-56]
MPATDLSLLVKAAEQAGDIACRYTGPAARRWDKPGGAGPVTEADLAVNAMLEDMLQQARPGYGWLSEETEDSAARLARDRVFIIDPIDGTRSFAEGSRTWAHSIAVAEQGEVTAAVVYLPQRELMYTAAKGLGAACNGNPIKVSSATELASTEILAAKPNLQAHHWLGGAPPAFIRSYRPSLAYRLAKVADGRFGAMLTLRPSWEWDIAAGDLLLREAGGAISDRSGSPLRFNNPHPRLNGVIAGCRALHQALLAALDPSSPGIAGL